MDSTNSSFQISLNSTLESVDISSLLLNNQQAQENRPEQFCNDYRSDRSTFIEKIIRIYLKHPMSLECLTDWVDLFNTKLEDCDKLPTGKVQLIKLFRESRCDLIDIFFFVKCEKCRKCTKVQPDKKLGLKCSHCDESLKTNETNFFVILPLQQQIVQSVESHWTEISQFFNDISESDTSEDTDSKSYSDVHDGAILRNILKEYKDSSINILSLCLNVDGANKLKSNSFSVWPIQLLQNFLPPHIRFLPQNIILNGLYYHKSKDGGELCFHEFLRPLIDELNELKREPISMVIEDEHYEFKPIITHCAVDLPAKSKLQQTKQYGGYDACTYCHIPGEKILIETPKSQTKPIKNPLKKCNKRIAMKINKKSNNKCTDESKSKHFVRYVDGSYKLRDETETLVKMLAASECKKSIDGIKDVSCLVGLEHFNIIWSVGPEYMHCCLQGMGKRMLNLFLNPKYSDKDYYIVPSKKKTLNKKIMNIKPTSSIVRKPRSLNQLSNFKASEIRSMFLYYLPVCLPGCLPNVYVKHVRLFSAALYILLKKTISREEVHRAEKMLQLFVQQHQQLFGKQNMVMVVHLLKHLGESVRQLGPLWCHSAFSFERNNGCLLKLVTGTTDVLHQISSKYCLAKSINRQNNEVQVKKTTDVDMNVIFLLGKAIDFKETASHIFDSLILEIVDFTNTLLVHKRIKFKKITYTSVLYTRPKRSIDYFIGLNNGVVGKAKYYFSYKGKICVMLQEYEIIDTIDHISKVLSTKRLIIAPVEEIERKYLFIIVGLNNYIVCRPNPYENE